MLRTLRFLFLLAALSTLFGCAEEWVKPDPFAAFPARVNRFDIHTGWRALPTASSLEVQGVASNVRYAYMEDLELQVSLRDRGERTLAQETFYFIPPLFPRDETRPFSVSLKALPPPGARLHFLYKYRANDGLEQFPWVSAFTVDASTGELLGPKE